MPPLPPMFSNSSFNKILSIIFCCFSSVAVAPCPLHSPVGRISRCPSHLMRSSQHLVYGVRISAISPSLYPALSLCQVLSSSAAYFCRTASDDNLETPPPLSRNVLSPHYLHLLFFVRLFCVE